MQRAITHAAPTSYGALALDIRQAGLLERRIGYYGVKIGLTVSAFGLGWAAVVIVGNSWATLGLAAFLGLVLTQLGFVGHDAGHQQVFSTRRANRLLGLLIGNAMIGLSFGWWVAKHSAHHAHPNEVGRDPDVGNGFVILQPDDGQLVQRVSIRRFMARWQAPLFFPLMVLRASGLHPLGTRSILRRRDRGTTTELALMLLHAALLLFVVFWILSPLKALAFLAVQQSVFSLYLGCSFAPNHKGMPLIPDGAQMGFAQRQVVTSRNIVGSWFVTFALGGLNFQMEHHLFSSMPRPNLRRAQPFIRAFCQSNQLPYSEDSLCGSYGQILRHLAALGATVRYQSA